MAERISDGGIEQAAEAFQQQISPSPAQKRAPNGKFAGDAPPEEIFELAPHDEENDEGYADDPDEKRVPKPQTVEDDEVDESDEESDEEEDQEPPKKPKEAEDDGDEIPLDAAVVVKVDGEDHRVSLREALDGYIRTQTFHQRLNALHQERSTLDREVGEVAKARQRYGSLLDTLQQQLDSLNLQEPDWKTLFKADPDGAEAQYQKWQQYRQQRDALKTERERVTAEEREEQQKQVQRYVNTERQKMLVDHPEWKDRKVVEKDWASMARTAKTAGFSDEEFQTLYDSRMVQILLKASKYDRIMSKKPKPSTETSVDKRVFRPKGGSGSRTVQRGSDAARRLARTGSVEAAAGVFSDIMRRER